MQGLSSFVFGQTLFENARQGEVLKVSKKLWFEIMLCAGFVMAIS